MERKRNERSKTVILNHPTPTDNKLDVVKPKARKSMINLPAFTSLKITSHLALEPNLNFNEQMEDVGIKIHNFGRSPKKYLFGIFDGHNGVDCAQLVSEQLPYDLDRIMFNNPGITEKNIVNSFKVVDQKCSNFVSLGCTATIVYIDNFDLYCANVGDSTAMLVYGDKAEKLSYDDKVTDIAESKRIEKGGGFIEDERLNGILAISRAMGDFMLKHNGLISVPHVNKKSISENFKYCIIASDGVWDVVDEKILFELSINVHGAKEFATKIVKYAVDHESEDNISCVAIKFDFVK